MPQNEITISAIECENDSEAIGWVDAQGGGAAVSLGGKSFWMTKAEAERIAALGVEFAYLFDHKGVIMTVPVND